MFSTGELKDSVQDALRVIERKKGVKEAEVFASTAEHRVMRLCYATNVPSNCLEEPKFVSSFGLSVRVLFSNGKIGFGKTECAIGKTAVSAAFEKAKRNTVLDPDFKGFPVQKEKPLAKSFFDKNVCNISGERAVDFAYECLAGAFDALSEKKPSENVNLTGEIDFGSSRMAVANTNSILECDEDSFSSASLTTVLEAGQDVSGMSLDASASLAKLNVHNVGRESVEKAISLKGGGTLDSGDYPVVFGNLAFADLLHNLFVVGLNSVEANSTPYCGDLNKAIGAPSLNIVDDGTYPDGVGSRRVTDEGLATGKTLLVENGILEDFLSDDYYARKFSNLKTFIPRNGFRSGYSSEPRIVPTNLVVGKGDSSREELISGIKKGIFVGRIWYTYPLNGFASADFTSTIRGDSYIIENGRIKCPLAPNTLRINDNLTRILKEISAIGKEQKQVVSWGEESVVITPEVKANRLRVQRIMVGK